MSSRAPVAILSTSIFSSTNIIVPLARGWPLSGALGQNQLVVAKPVVTLGRAVPGWSAAGEATLQGPGCVTGRVQLPWRCAREKGTAPLLLEVVV